MLLRALLLATLTLCFSAHADDDDLARCTSIDDDARRLGCYDAAAGRTAQAATAPEEVAAPAPGAVPAPAAAPAPTPAPVPIAAPEPADAAGFGAEQLPRASEKEKDEPDRIESSLPGRFEGWNKDTRFALENGQVWQCVNCRDVYHVRDNPKVVVERGFLGGYWLRVEGLNQQARVRRVR